MHRALGCLSPATTDQEVELAIERRGLGVGCLLLMAGGVKPDWVGIKAPVLIITGY